MTWPDKSSTATTLERFRSASLHLDCGAHSYGTPILQVGADLVTRTLRIGRYCSIAPQVEIFVGLHGRHPTGTLTSYPLAMAVSPEVRAASDVKNQHADLFEPTRHPDNLNVEIGHDVWIGARATIMAGLAIGTGAVISNSAVVTRDVPPYAIVGGVPAKIIRYRHPPEVIEALLASRWWELEPDEIWRRCGSLVSSTRVMDMLLLLTQDR